MEIKYAIDLALLTYIMEGGNTSYGRTKLQKTGFLSELKLRDHGLVGPHFAFYRWDKGPFSQGLWTAVDVLTTKGFVHPGQPSLTRRGQELMSLALEFKRETKNRLFFTVLDEALSYCRPRNGSELMNAIYGMDVRPEFSDEKMKVRDMPMGTDILVPPDIISLRVAHDLEKLILEELEISEAEIRAATQNSLPAMEKQLVAYAMNAGRQSS